MTTQWPEHMQEEIARNKAYFEEKFAIASTEFNDGGDATGRQCFSDRRFKSEAQLEEDRELKHLRNREGNKSWKKKTGYPSTRVGRRLWKIRKIIKEGITPD